MAYISDEELAALKGVVEAAKGIALRNSPTHNALRRALAALDSMATMREEEHC